MPGQHRCGMVAVMPAQLLLCIRPGWGSPRQMPCEVVRMIGAFKATSPPSPLAARNRGLMYMHANSE